MPGQEHPGVDGLDAAPGGVPGGREVLLDRFPGPPPVIDEHDVFGPTRQRLDPECSRTRIEVEDTGFEDRVEAHQRIEHRLPHPIEGGTRVFALRGDEMAPPRFTGNDSHPGDRTLFPWTLNSA